MIENEIDKGIYWREYVDLNGKVHSNYVFIELVENGKCNYRLIKSKKGKMWLQLPRKRKTEKFCNQLVRKVIGEEAKSIWKSINSPILNISEEALI